MSRDASIELDWADGEHTFRLGWGELSKIQELCDAGPFVVLQRLADGTWKLDDIREVIRWGLIGGGKPVDEARKLVKTYVEGRPPSENIIFAHGILAAGLQGAPEEEVGNAEAANPAESDLTTSPTES